MKQFKLFLTISLFFVQLFIFAQEKTAEFKAFKEKYTGKDFDYNDVPKPEKEFEPGFFTKLFERIIQFLTYLPWEIIFYFTIGLFLIFIAFRVYKNGGIMKKNAKNLYDESDFDLIEENLVNVNLDSLINKAENEENYALAIRYLHYQNLQNLDKKGWIEWNPKKTNQQFINQIKDEKAQRTFSQNTKIFNQVWFGEFQLDANKYTEFKSIFNQFNQYLVS